MKKLLFILALCLSAFASAQCPPGNLTQNAKWKFVFSQCMEDTLVIKYADTSQVAYIDANGNLTTIAYAALLDSINISDQVILTPEMFGAVGDGVADDTGPWNDLTAAAEANGQYAIVTCKRDAIYKLTGGITFDELDVTIFGNNATIKRDSNKTSTLTAQRANGDNFVTVADPSVFSVLDNITVFKTVGDFTTLYLHSGVSQITSISGDTLFISPVLANYSGYSGAKTTYDNGATVVVVYDMFLFNDDNSTRKVHIQDLNFDGNKDENTAYPLTWSVSYTISAAPRMSIYNCTFSDVRNENIICNSFDVQRSVFKNCIGSAVHYGQGLSANRSTETSVFAYNRADTMCTIYNGHNEGVVEWSFSVGNIYIAYNRFDSSGQSIVGPIDSDDQSVFVIGNKAKRSTRIQTVNKQAPSTGETYIRYEGNEFYGCGQLFLKAQADTGKYGGADIINNTFLFSSIRLEQTFSPTNILNNFFYGNTTDSFQNTSNIVIDGNTFYNRSIFFNTYGNITFTNNKVLNDSANMLPKTSIISFSAVSSPLTNSGTLVFSNNLVQDNNPSNTGAIGVIFSGFNGNLAEINDNVIGGFSQPVFMSTFRNSTHQINVRRNYLYARVRRVDSTGVNAYNDAFNLGAVTFEYNYLYADSMVRRICNLVDYGNNGTGTFIGNQIWSENDGGRVADENTFINDTLNKPYGLFLNNTYNGLITLPTINYIRADKTSYTIFQNNTRYRIRPKMPRLKPFSQIKYY